MALAISRGTAYTNVDIEANTMIRVLVTLALASLRCGYSQCPSLDSPSNESPVVTIEAPKRQGPAKVASPLWIEVIMTNQSDHPISFWKSTNVTTNPIKVFDEAGKPLRDKRPGLRNGRFDPKLLDPNVDPGDVVRMLSGSLICVTLKPGERVVDRMDVTKFFDINSPGTYIISVDRPGIAKGQTAKSQSVTVMVAK